MTVFNLIEEFPKPVIAAVNGFALGGGLELAMSAHVRIASDNARMGLPETSLGLIPGYGGTQRLPQLIGKGRALEMIFSAKMIDAPTALSYGLVNQVVPQADLLEAAQTMAKSFMKNSIVAMGYAIESVNAGLCWKALSAMTWKYRPLAIVLKQKISRREQPRLLKSENQISQEPNVKVSSWKSLRSNASTFWVN